MELSLLIFPIAATILFWMVSERRLIYWVNAVSSGCMMGIAVDVSIRLQSQKTIRYSWFTDMIYIDALNGLLLLLTSLLSLLVAVYSIAYIEREYQQGTTSLQKLRVYFSLLHTLILLAFVLILVQNMAVMWLAMEAAILAIAALIGYDLSPKSIAAAWKYMIINTVAAGFALLGIAMLYTSSAHVLGQSIGNFNWKMLYDYAAELDSHLVKPAFVLILVGLGTVAGLAPMHFWLPDASSHAPAPINAFLSGVMLNTAMYGIIRMIPIINGNLGNSTFAGNLLLLLGILSMGTAAICILIQRDHRKIFSYSSIEHMGIITFALGMMSPAAIAGGLLHMLNHGLAKPILFLASGSIIQRYDTKLTYKLKGVLQAMPLMGTILFIGIFATAGVPPFSLFTSQLSIVIATFHTGRYVSIGCFLLFSLLVFAGYIANTAGIFIGPAPEEITSKKEKTGFIEIMVLSVPLAATFMNSCFLPDQIQSLLQWAGDIITRGM